MDLGSVIGTAGTYLAIVATMLLGAGLGVYVDIPSVVLVVAGTQFVCMMAFPLPVYMLMGKLFGKCYFFSMQKPADLIQQLVGFATMARKDGILALEAAEEQISDDFLKKGIRLMVDGTEPEIIRDVLEIEIDNIEGRHKIGIDVLAGFGEYGPAMGMIGTLIGLVAMLQNMSDPAAIGPAMAVALLTTFYGAVMANALGLPFARRLGVRNIEEMLVRNIMLTGILSIQAGDNPRIVEQKLNSFLGPKERSSQFD